MLPLEFYHDEPFNKNATMSHLSKLETVIIVQRLIRHVKGKKKLKVQVR